MVLLDEQRRHVDVNGAYTPGRLTSLSSSMPLTTTRRRLLEAALPVAALGALSAVAELAAARTESAVQRMPVLFIGHGSPMNAIQDNAFTRFLGGLPAKLARPKAILVISALCLSLFHESFSEVQNKISRRWRAQTKKMAAPWLSRDMFPSQFWR